MSGWLISSFTYVQSCVVLFAVCFLPMHVFFLWFYFDPLSLQHYNQTWHLLKIIGFCLAYTNSCINPIALYCISTNYRKYFNLALCCAIKPGRVNETIFNVAIIAQQTVNLNNTVHTPIGGRSPITINRPLPQCSSRQRLTSDLLYVPESYPFNDLSEQRL